MRSVAVAAAFIADTVTSSLRTFAAAARDVRLDDPAARTATAAVSAAVIATLIVTAMHLDDPWWATVSGYMATQGNAAASVRKALLRITGTIVGAYVAVTFVDWVAYDVPACTLLIFTVCTVSIIGNNVSEYVYSWLLVGLTYVLVTLLSLDNPATAPNTAIIRVLEVVIGSTVAATVSYILNPASAAPPPPALVGPVCLARALHHAARDPVERGGRAPAAHLAVF